VISTGAQLTNSGLVVGNGTLVGPLVNQGTVQPGNSIGTLTVDGTFQQTSAGIFNVELGDGAGDLVDVSGAASLSGSLVAQAVGDVTFELGDRYDILKAVSGVTGTFSTTSLPSLPSSLYWRVDYGATMVSLVVVPEPATMVMAAVVLVGVAGRRRCR
jgi:hypothetical protein